MSANDMTTDINAVIDTLQSACRTYTTARSDLELSTNFNIVGSKLSDLIAILQRCNNHVATNKDAIDEDVYDSLTKPLSDCHKRSTELDKVLQRTLSGGNGDLQGRYQKAIQSFSDGRTIEELMLQTVKEIQPLVEHRAFKSALLEQARQLKEISSEMESIISPESEEKGSGMHFIHHGAGAQMNNINRGNGQQINNNGSVEEQNFNSPPAY